MKKRVFRDYREKLVEDLQDPELAYMYLNECLQHPDPRIFLLALKDVYEARNIDMTKLAQDAHLNRENLYRILSKKGNPTLTSLISILHNTGFTLAIQPYKK